MILEAHQPRAVTLDLEVSQEDNAEQFPQLPSVPASLHCPARLAWEPCI